MPKTKGGSRRKASAKSAAADKWQEYERLKAALQRVEMPAGEYEKQIKRIVKELGI